MRATDAYEERDSDPTERQSPKTQGHGENEGSVAASFPVRCAGSRGLMKISDP